MIHIRNETDVVYNTNPTTLSWITNAATDSTASSITSATNNWISINLPAVQYPPTGEDYYEYGRPIDLVPGRTTPLSYPTTAQVTVNSGTTTNNYVVNTGIWIDDNATTTIFNGTVNTPWGGANWYYKWIPDMGWQVVLGSDCGVIDSKEAKRQAMRSRMAPAILNHKGVSPRAVDPLSADFSKVKENEIVALGLLKTMLDENRWRKYLKYGFVDVQGKSGLVYQILRGKHIIRVFSRGKELAGLCIYTKGNVPPTDDVITRMIMAELDETELWKRGNVRNLTLPCTKDQLTDEILHQLVAKAA